MPSVRALFHPPARPRARIVIMRVRRTAHILAGLKSGHPCCHNAALPLLTHPGHHRKNPSGRWREGRWEWWRGGMADQLAVPTLNTLYLSSE